MGEWAVSREEWGEGEERDGTPRQSPHSVIPSVLSPHKAAALEQGRSRPLSPCGGLSDHEAGQEAAKPESESRLCH